MIRHHLPALLASALLVALLLVGVHWALSGLDHLSIGGQR